MASGYQPQPELLPLKCTWSQRKRGKPPSTLKIKPDRNNQKTWKSHSVAWVLLFEVIKMLVCTYLRTKNLSHHMSEHGSGSVRGMVHLGGEASSLRPWVLWAGWERGGARQQCMLGSRRPCLPSVPRARWLGGEGGEPRTLAGQNHSH